MPIVSNPQVMRFIIPVARAKVILILRPYTTEEYAHFMGSRYAMNRLGKLDDQSMKARIDFVDKLLIGIEALDKDGQPDYVVYSSGGKEERLTPQVENWTKYIDASWKVSAGFDLEALVGEIEDNAVKN